MENTTNTAPIKRPVRRRKTKLQIFKEAYLPTIIIVLAFIVVLWFLVGGAIHRNQKPDPTVPSTDPPAPSIQPTETEDPIAKYEAEAQQRLSQAAACAKNYNYDEAVSILAAFPGNMEDFPELKAAYESYVQTLNTMVTWNDPADVATLSFHILIADPELAYNDSQYASSYRKNFITTTQFALMLEQLYDNGYVLVDFYDVYGEVDNESTGKTEYTALPITLPEGKQPLMLVQTNVNYYTYMNSGSADKKPDGFASRLNPDLSTNMTLADGSTVTGAYDMVPILETFINANPDFSYHGARAIVAATGYNGIFGYRVNDKSLSADALAAEREGAKAVAQALTDAGYHIACYTYDNINYASKSASAIQSDLQKWEDEILPWLGETSVDILVYAKEGDIGDDAPYSGSKFNVMYNAGYRYFLGTGETGWSQIGDKYVRHNRIMVTGAYLQSHDDWYTGLFDPDSLLG